MRLSYLKIENFRNISKIEIDNFKDINIFVGKNGEGKSSLLHSLIFLMTDNLDAKIEDYVKWGEKEFYLKVIFDHLGKKYDYCVSGGLKSTKRELIIDDNKLDVYTNSDATKKISEIINPILTLYSSISEQGEVTKLLFEKPAERMEKLKKLFNIEKIQNIVQEIKNDIALKENDIISFDAEINTLQSTKYFFKEIPDLPIVNVDDLENIKNNLLANKELANKENIQYEYYLKELDKYNKDLQYKEVVRADIIDIQKKNSGVTFVDLPEYDINNHEKIKKEANKLEKDRIILSNTIEKYEASSARVISLSEKIEKLNNDYDKLIIRRTPRGEEITEESLKKLQDDINRIDVELLQYDKKYSLCLSGKCPECEQEYHADIKQIEKNIIQLKSDKAEITLVLESETIRYKEIEQIKKDNEKIKFQKERIEQEIANINIEIDSIERDLIKPEEDLKTIDENIMNINIEVAHQDRLQKIYNDTIKRNETANKLKQEYENKILVLQTTFDSLSKIEKPIEFKKTMVFNQIELDEVNKKITDYNNKVNEIKIIEEHNSFVKKQKKDNERLINEKSEIRDQISIKSRELNECKKLMDKDFPAWIISNGIDFIKKEMNKFFVNSYRKPYIIDIKQDKKGVDFYYGYNKDNLVSVNLASGFEKSILAMSFRYALCAMQNLNIMILDEIDSDADDENSMKLFRSLLKNKEIQFFIITHKMSTVDILENEYNSKIFEISRGNILKEKI